jgi:hypothetical protein
MGWKAGDFDTLLRSKDTYYFSVKILKLKD